MTTQESQGNIVYTGVDLGRIKQLSDACDALAAEAYTKSTEVGDRRIVLSENVTYIDTICLVTVHLDVRVETKGQLITDATKAKPWLQAIVDMHEYIDSPHVLIQQRIESHLTARNRRARGVSEDHAAERVVFVDIQLIAEPNLDY